MHACMGHAHYMHARTHSRSSFCFLNKITHGQTFISTV